MNKATLPHRIDLIGKAAQNGDDPNPEAAMTRHAQAFAAAVQAACFVPHARGWEVAMAIAPFEQASLIDRTGIAGLDRASTSNI